MYQSILKLLKSLSGRVLEHSCNTKWQWRTHRKTTHQKPNSGQWVDQSVKGWYYLAKLCCASSVCELKQTQSANTVHLHLSNNNNFSLHVQWCLLICFYSLITWLGRKQIFATDVKLTTVLGHWKTANPPEHKQDISVDLFPLTILWVTDVVILIVPGLSQLEIQQQLVLNMELWTVGPQSIWACLRMWFSSCFGWCSSLARQVNAEILAGNHTHRETSNKSWKPRKEWTRFYYDTVLTLLPYIVKSIWECSLLYISYLTCGNFFFWFKNSWIITFILLSRGLMDTDRDNWTVHSRRDLIEKEREWKECSGYQTAFTSICSQLKRALLRAPIHRSFSINPHLFLSPMLFFQSFYQPGDPSRLALSISHCSLPPVYFQTIKPICPSTVASPPCVSQSRKDDQRGR